MKSEQIELLSVNDSSNNPSYSNPMNGYTKLFGSIIGSTIWRESPETCKVWITMLAMANRYGIVEVSLPGLADFCRISLKETQKAISILSAPDTFSRTKDNQGRRIQETDGGWLILNHAKYREKMSVDERREYNRVKQAEFRERKQKSNMSMTPDASLAESAHTEAQEEEDEVSQPIEETIYEIYPRKVGKKDALKAIKNALATKTPAELQTAVKAYAEAVALWPESDRQFIPHPATWFNRGSYDDDPQTWKRHATHRTPNSRSFENQPTYAGITEKL